MPTEYEKSFTFEPNSPEEEIIFAQQALRVDLQVLINEAMLKNGVTKEELSRRLDWTEEDVADLFQDDWNPTIAVVAWVCHAVEAKLDLFGGK
jgi:hypothetical protein